MLLGAVLVSAAITAFVLFVPGVQKLFGFTYLPWQAYLTAAGLAIAPVPIVELSKCFMRLAQKKMKHRDYCQQE